MFGMVYPLNAIKMLEMLCMLNLTQITPHTRLYLLFVRVQKLDDECMAWEQDNSLQAHWLNELYSLHSNGPSVIFHWATIIMHTTQLNGGIVLYCCQAAS